MLKLLPIDFDQSNQSFNVFVIEVQKAEDRDGYPIWVLQPIAFPTLLLAMSYLQPQIAEPLRQTHAGSYWQADLKADSAFQGYVVRITQLVMVL